ncbi:MAG: Ig-like domain-containing protein [Candidatus Eremiobacteraeota bacterium]|nr:Ig-like domain-containing protein [Candidatus Eremiobacteraeota bacterium]
MKGASLLGVLFAIAGCFATAHAAIAQTGAPTPAPAATEAPATPAPAPAPAPGATPVPITVDPPSAGVAVDGTTQLHAYGVFGDLTVTVADPNLVTATVDQGSRVVTLSGRAIGTTTVTIKDARGVSRDVPVRIAYTAGMIADGAVVHLTGNPASVGFVRALAAAAASRAARPRPGATVVAPPDDLVVAHSLPQDNVANVDVPVIIQAEGMITVTGTTHVRVYNDAAPPISPNSLMVSDYPETLIENGVLFTADLQRGVPSRFLYFHYNPPGQVDRRVVLRAQNNSNAPSVVQFISGSGGPDTNEMLAGHLSTQRFLSRLAQNEGELVSIPPNSAVNLVEQAMPAHSVVSNILQLRVLNGSGVHLALFAQNASDSPDATPMSDDLLTSTVRHARGTYEPARFYRETLWNTTDPYLELPVGQLPLPNMLHGEALSGDYGVQQSYQVKVVNPTRSPQAIAIYENPRGGRATGTYLIDGVLVQSHGVPPFSRYKVRQYTVPAKGYIRVTIETMPEAGSSYPLRLVFAPDDGSVAPGAPGSPVY